MIERRSAPLAPAWSASGSAPAGSAAPTCTISGTRRTGDFVVNSPLMLGHEVAGEIVEVSARGRGGLSVGDHVAVNPSRWCGQCAHCREGRENLCENIYFMGSASKTPHMQGGFASRFDALPAQCVKVSGTSRSRPRPSPNRWPSACMPSQGPAHGRGPYGLVVGAGPIGLLTMHGGATCRHDGACGRGHCRGAARGRDAPWRRRGHRRLGRRSEPWPRLAEPGPSTWSSRFPAALRALAPRSACAPRRHGGAGRQPSGRGHSRAGERRHGPRNRPQGLVSVRPGIRGSRAPDRSGTGRRSLDRHGGAPPLGGSGRLPPGSRPLAERQGDADRGVTRPRARDGARLPEPITGGRESRRGPA